MFKVGDKVCRPHKHAELIKQWADNPALKFQYHSQLGMGWQDVAYAPDWDSNYEYRIKPESKPDVVVATWIEAVQETSNADVDVVSKLDVFGRKENINCSFTFDGETGELKSVEMINVGK